MASYLKQPGTRHGRIHDMLLSRTTGYICYTRYIYMELLWHPPLQSRRSDMNPSSHLPLPTGDLTWPVITSSFTNPEVVIHRTAMTSFFTKLEVRYGTAMTSYFAETGDRTWTNNDILLYKSKGQTWNHYDVLLKKWGDQTWTHHGILLYKTVIRHDDSNDIIISKSSGTPI